MTAPGGDGDGTETGVAGRAWRPCCGVCRLTGLIRVKAGHGWECLSCRVPWDGSEVSRDKLPVELEASIAAGDCTRDEAFLAFLRMDDLASAAASEEITADQGAELVVLDALRMSGVRRPQ